MLIVCVGGTGTYTNSAGSVEVVRGAVGIVEPDDPGILFSSTHDPYLHYYCRFSGDYACHLARRIVAERKARFAPDADYLSYAEHIRKMGFLHSRTAPAGDAMEMGHREVLLAEILVGMLSRLDARQPRRTPDDRTAILNYLYERMSESVTVSAVADHFSVSRNTLMRRVKALFGISLVRLHEQLRVEWAGALLESGQFTVREVAERVGYRSPDYFSRVFRRRTGKTPSTLIPKNRR
jgi:AraC-like DNA-binding protein